LWCTTTADDEHDPAIIRQRAQKSWQRTVSPDDGEDPIWALATDALHSDGIDGRFIVYMYV
jgi:hypothetical protein